MAWRAANLIRLEISSERAARRRSAVSKLIPGLSFIRSLGVILVVTLMVDTG
jgi:hypothetical protein